jgi:hypothetical protein
MPCAGALDTKGRGFNINILWIRDIYTMGKRLQYHGYEGVRYTMERARVKLLRLEGPIYYRGFDIP